jgi:hypothetical protein
MFSWSIEEFKRPPLEPLFLTCENKKRLLILCMLGIIQKKKQVTDMSM